MAEIKIFRNGRSRAVRSTGGRPVTGPKYGKIGSLFRHPFFIRDPSGTFPGRVPRRLEVPIFRNGELRAARSTGDRPVARSGPEIRKNRFSLWIPVYHLKSLQDLPWRCFTKTRSQDIQKQRVTGRPKWGRPVCHWDLCVKNPKSRFSLWTPVYCPESLQDLPWKSKMKTRGPNIQKRLITDSSKQNCAYSNPYSQAVTHPSTNGSQPCLTSVIGRELVFSR